MKNLFSWQRLWPHLVAVIGFMILSIAYVSPVLEGKKLSATDEIQAKGAAREVLDYKKASGEWSAWTNSMFGGMPAYLVAADFPTSISTKIGQGVNKLLPAPANYFLIGLVSAYVLFLVLGASGWLAAVGAVAFSFSCFNVINLEAGHISQVLAIMYAPGVLAGVILAFRRDWLAGAALTALFLSLELYANHVQITYYLGIGVVLLVIVESVSLIKKGLASQLVPVLGGLALAAVLAVGTHTTRLWSAYDYTKETIRGKSELTAGTKNGGAKKGDGLDKEYAFTYSYGVGELMTLVIPNAYGGASYGPVSTSSEFYKTLTSRGVDAASAQGFIQQLPLYWGDQPIMGGPNYVGAIVFFLFVLGLFIVKSPLKHWAAGVVVLYVIWALGKSFAGINYLFFDYFPMFNKFRAVTMVISLAQLLMVMVGVMALLAIAQRKITAKELQKPFLISVGITGGLMLIMALMPSLFFSFRGTNDPMIAQQFTQATQNQEFGQQLLNAVIQDRESLMKSDAIRGLIFIALAAAIVWFYAQDKLKSTVFYSVLLALVIFDLFGVDKRYLNNEDFVSAYVAQGVTTPSPADEQILRDTDPDFRVYDLASQGGPFNSAQASYFHKSLGGYHAAKLRRYQELFENQLMGTEKPNIEILNMLNTKYFITPDQQGNKVAQPNPDAYGHAWFVKSFKTVPNADAEMAALRTTKLREEAIIGQQFAAKLEGLKIATDSTARISLISYKPNELIYETNANGEGLAVFSEIYYNVRDEWQVTIDDKPADMLRANYVLRALRVPAGKHTIKFRFEPVSVTTGTKIDLMSSLLLVGLVVGAVVVESRKKKSA